MGCFNGNLLTVSNRAVIQFVILLESTAGILESVYNAPAVMLYECMNFPMTVWSRYQSLTDIEVWPGVYFSLTVYKVEIKNKLKL